METARPRRKLYYSKTKRWITNFGFSITNTIMMNLAFPIVGVAASLFATNKGWGLFNIIDTPAIITIPLYLLLFDLAIYFQHRLFHTFNPLWRLHRMHHSDVDYDLSTGIRFHPLSITISGFIKISLIFLLGPLAIAVLVSEVLLNATSMFNHSNWNLPKKVDAILRRIIVTPDMHRVHHSVNSGEYNCNFGFNFPWWDKLFGTYKAQPYLNHDVMNLGIKGLQNEGAMTYLSLMREPFQKDLEKSD